MLAYEVDNWVLITENIDCEVTRKTREMEALVEVYLKMWGQGGNSSKVSTDWKPPGS